MKIPKIQFSIFSFLTLVTVNLFFTLTINAQNSNLFVSYDGKISFFSKAPLEDIEAVNKQVSSVINVSTGEIRFKVTVNKFIFPNATMQEHFNENYLETEKYPIAEFKGRIMDFTNVKLVADGLFNVTITGSLTIHGKTQTITQKGTLERKGNAITGKSTFKVKLADYDIKIPSIVVKNIAEEVDVTVNTVYKPATK